MKHGLFTELRRRNMFRSAALYVGAIWALAQGIAQLGPPLGAPDWITRWFLAAAGIGFPFFLGFAWRYRLTPEGLRRERGTAAPPAAAEAARSRLDRWIIGVLGIALVLLLTDRFVLRGGINESIDIPANSVAVLPFADLSPNKDRAFFSDGITEDLINLLTGIPQLRITARTSSFAIRDQNLDIGEIGRRLHVAYIITGSVQAVGDKVRITAHLLDAATDTQRWSQTYDRTLDDIFSIQDEIAGAVSRQLKVTLLGQSPQMRTTDPRAYSLYLEARQLGRQSTAESFQASDALYRQVLAIDPNYAPAWNGLAANYNNEANMGLLANAEGYGHSREAIDKALAIDPDYAPALAALGYIEMRRSNLRAAAGYLERATALAPADTGVLGNAATFMVTIGRAEQSLALFDAIVSRDPLNATVRFNQGITQATAGHYDEAIATQRALLQLSPGRGGAHYQLGVAMLLKGDARAALAEMQAESSTPWRMIGMPLVLHALGRTAEADAAQAALIAQFSRDAAYNIAYVCAYRGQTDGAFQWLDKAVDYGDPGVSDAAFDTLFTSLHDDPRWQPFLRRIGYAPEQLAGIRFDVAAPTGAATSD